MQPTQSTHQSVNERGGATIMPLLLRVCGVRLSYLFAPIVVFFYFATGGSARRSMIAFHRQLGTQNSWAATWHSFLNFLYFAHSLIDRMAMMSGAQPLTSGIQTTGLIRSVPPGSFLIGAHLGDWFCASGQLAHEIKGTLAIVMNQQLSRNYQRILGEQGQVRFSTIDSSEGGLNFLLAVKQALDDGSIVCFLGDRWQPEHRTAMVPFLGKPAPIGISVFDLAMRFGRPVYSVFAPKSAPVPFAPYQVQCSVIWPGASSVSDSPPPSAESMAATYVQHLEVAAQRWRHQWFNFFDFWQMPSN